MGPRKRHAHHIELARRGSWRKAVWVRSTPPSPPHMAMAIKQLYAWLNSASASSSRLFCVRTRWASLFHTMSSSLHRRSYKGRTSRRTRRRVAAVPRRGWPSGGLSLVDELPRLLSSALVACVGVLGRCMGRAVSPDACAVCCSSSVPKGGLRALSHCFALSGLRKADASGEKNMLQFLAPPALC